MPATARWGTGLLTATPLGLPISPSLVNLGPEMARSDDEGRKPRKPAASKNAASPKRGDPLSPGSVKETVLAIAAIGWTVQHQDAWNKRSALRDADEAFLQSITEATRKHRLKVPATKKGGTRLSESTRRLGYIRWDFERLLEAHVAEVDSPDRDELIAIQLRLLLEENGLVVARTDISTVLDSLIKEQLDGARRKRLKDWVRGPKGVQNTAGVILEKLGVRLGWLGSSSGNTHRLRKIVEAADTEFHSRTANQLQITAFLLSALGVPPTTLTWVTLMVFLASKGEDLALRLGELPPRLPQSPEDLRTPRPARFLEMSKTEFEMGFRHAWDSMEALRLELTTRFPPGGAIPNPFDSRTWGDLWTELTCATLPMPMAMAIDQPTDTKQRRSDKGE